MRRPTCCRRCWARATPPRRRSDISHVVIAVSPIAHEWPALERELKLGQNKAFYAKALADRGFHITSINSDKPEAVEYEVVKGSTFEVQIDLEAGKAKNVDVTTNAWQSDATERALDASKRR